MPPMPQPIRNKVAFAQSPGTDSYGLSMKAKKGVVSQRDKKVIKCRGAEPFAEFDRFHKINLVRTCLQQGLRESAVVQ